MLLCDKSKDYNNFISFCYYNKKICCIFYNFYKKNTKSRTLANFPFLVLPLLFLYNLSFSFFHSFSRNHPCFSVRWLRLRINKMSSFFRLQNLHFKIALIIITIPKRLAWLKLNANND